MPHIIIEYSDNLLPDLDVGKLVGTLHETLAAGGIDKTRIKTRAVKLEHYNVGEKGAKGSMIHGTLLLLEGRDVPTKEKLSKPLYEALKASIKTRDVAVTFEVRDMVKDTYYL